MESSIISTNKKDKKDEVKINKKYKITFFIKILDNDNSIRSNSKRRNKKLCII